MTKTKLGRVFLSSSLALASSFSAATATATATATLTVSEREIVKMGFFSFMGRVLFASLFILSAWQMFNEFDATGGPFAKELIPKLTVARKNLSSKLGLAIPDINVRQVFATIIFLKGVGGILFVFGSTFGSFLLLSYLALTTPFLYDFYNYRPNNPKHNLLLNEFIQSMALFGALLFFIGMKNSIPRKQFRKKTPKTKAV